MEIGSNGQFPLKHRKINHEGHGSVNTDERKFGDRALNFSQKEMRIIITL